MSERDRFDRFDDYLDRATDRHAFPEDDGGALSDEVDRAAGALADSIRREKRAKLIEKRHDLANQATVARLQADEMFLEIKRLDAEIDALGREP